MGIVNRMSRIIYFWFVFFIFKKLLLNCKGILGFMKKEV